MNITDYKHIKYDLFHLMNKERFPQTTLSWQEYKTFNEIYQWAKDNCIKGKKTTSGGIAGGPYNRYHSIYFYNQKNFYYSTNQFLFETKDWFLVNKSICLHQ